jgi:pectinesterase
MGTNTPHAESSVSTHNTTALSCPWHAYSRVIYINTELPADLNLAGWYNRNNASQREDRLIRRIELHGPDANLSTRVSWSHQLTPAEAKQYLPATFLADPTTGIRSAKRLNSREIRRDSSPEKIASRILP